MRFREHRYPCDLPITVSIGVSTGDRQRADAVVINISQWGARLIRLMPLKVGEKLVLNLGMGLVPIDAEVRWCGQARADLARAGVRFVRPLDARAIARIRQSVNHHTSASANSWRAALHEMR